MGYRGEGVFLVYEGSLFFIWHAWGTLGHPKIDEIIGFWVWTRSDNKGIAKSCQDLYFLTWSLFVM